MNKPLLSLAALNALRIPPAKGGEVREWLRIFPYREAVLTDREQRLHYSDPDALISASLNADGRIHVDIDHASMTPGEGGDTRAYGYIVEMEERSDGIWARFDWNEAGAALMRDRAFWGLSPVLAHDKGGKISRIVSVALTNNPALRELAALTSQQKEDTMDWKAAIIEALGLAADASDDDILAALGKGKKYDDDAMEALTQIGGALGMSGDVKPAELVASVSALTASAGETQTTVAALTAQVAELRDERRTQEAEAFVDGAIREKRVGVKAARDHYIALHKENPDRARAMVAGLPQLGDAGISDVPPPGDDQQSALTAEENEVAKQLGLAPETYLAALKAERNKEAL